MSLGRIIQELRETLAKLVELNEQREAAKADDLNDEVKADLPPQEFPPIPF